MNVASLTGSQYEQVTVNSLSYSPALTLNISLAGAEEGRLEVLRSLADSQDILLELSGCPFSLVSFLSSASLLVPKTAVAAARDSQRDEEALFYLGVGAAVALLLSVGLLVCVLHSIRHPLLHGRDAKMTTSSSPFRYTDPPTAIYSEQFVNNNKAANSDRTTTPAASQSRRSGGAFTPLDDNLFPVETEVDFTPRYLLDQEPEDVASACYRADSPMPELTRLLQQEDEDEDDEIEAADGRHHHHSRATAAPPPYTAGRDRLRPNDVGWMRNGQPGGSMTQPDIVESTVSLPLLSPFYDPLLQRTPSSSLCPGFDGTAAPVSPSPSSTTWAPSLASTPEPRHLISSSARRRPKPLGKPPPPPRTDSLSSRSTTRSRRRPLSVPAPCHLRGESTKSELQYLVCLLVI
jgi:hypothetical protein